MIFKKIANIQISSLPLQHLKWFQPMIFTFPYAWLPICLAGMSNEMIFLARFIVKLKRPSVKSGHYQNLATFQNTYMCCVINSSRIHNPIAIIQIIFHIFRHSVSELNMTHLEFGPKFVMLATHPLEYILHICHNHHKRWLSKHFQSSVKFSNGCVNILL